MKPQKKVRMIPASGVNDILVPPLGAAENVVNCRYNDRGGWHANMGTESWWQFPATFSFPASSLDIYFDTPVDSCFQWKPSNSNTIYTFVEQGGRLYYMLGNKGGTNYLSDITVIQDGRHIRKASEIGTQYIHLGKHLLIINGRDKAILFSGDKVWRDFGFIQSTSQPHVNTNNTTYNQSSPLQLTGTSIWNNDTSALGLGTADGKVSQYSWRVSYISSTGSESPLSPIEELSWTSADGTFLYNISMEIPRGPEGTVARRIYRTKNIALSGELYYFEKQINENSSSWYVSYLPDNFLIQPAPSIFASSVIDTSYKFGDVWDGRLWLAKDNQIIYSEQGLFEQFGTASFFDFSNLQGGSVTQIVAFYSNLIVFRENAVNIILKTDNGYTMSTINSSIGTKASNSVVSVPNLGIVFMNDSGIWQLSGGLNADTLAIQKISEMIDEELKHRNSTQIHRTVAAYSSQEEIVWWHWADQASTVGNNRGVMLNLIPSKPQWSYFGAIAEDKWTCYNALTTTVDGRFLMGTVPVWTYPNPSYVSGTTDQFGPLQVLSSKATWGQKATVASDTDGTLSITVANGDEVNRNWESAWFNFNDESAKHRVYSVELQIMSKGDTTFDFYYQKDYSYVTSNTTAQKQAKPETVFTKNENSVFGAADLTVTKVTHIVNTSVITDENLIHVRYDVNTGLMNQFKFGLKGTAPFHLVSYNILFDTVEMPVLNQATRLQRGQSR